MRQFMLRAGVAVLAAWSAGACSGEGGGCGGGGQSTGPQLSCGAGTHQEGNACVANRQRGPASNTQTQQTQQTQQANPPVAPQ